jgi:class 3 adenylate cyclase
MVERRLAAILAMDVVGYGRLMGADEVGTLTALKRHRADLIDPATAAHNGRLVKTTGDGLLLEFASVVDAIGCAVAIQRGMLTRNADVPDSNRIIFRVGVNIGDIIIEGNDIFGDGVNVAARLEALCEPGGVCISRSANEQVRDKLSLSFADLGEHTVKNIARAVGVFGLAAKDIASLPEIPVARLEPAAGEATRNMRPAAIVAGVAAAILIGGATWWFTREGPPAPPQQLEVRLAAALARHIPGAATKYRDEITAGFVKLTTNRAMALALQTNGSFRTGEWPTREIAEEKALEKCQAQHNEPCAIIAVNDDVMSHAGGGSLPTRDAARVRYAGLYNAERIPGIRPRDAQRPDVQAYATATGARAVAFHPIGIVHPVTAAPNQRAAEEQALAACNKDPSRRDAGGLCFLYAVENRVVLPLRVTAPMATAPATAAAMPVPSADAALRLALLDRMTRVVPSHNVTNRDAQIDGYLKATAQKAIAAFPPTYTWRVHGWGTAALAEERSLEACQVRHGEPCVLLAVNDAVQPVPADGNWPRRPMARVGFDGLFDPQQIPATNSNTRQRADVAGYRDKPAPKAVAFHPWGRLFVVTDAAGQRAAEEQALAACNSDPERKGEGGPCLLYAVGNQVVLPKRSAAPLTN